MIEIKDIYNLFTGFFLTVDKKTHLVKEIRTKDKVLGENLSLENTVNLFFNLNFALSESLKVEDISFFIKEDNIVGEHLFPIKMNDGKEHYYKIIKSINQQKEEIYIYLEDFNSADRLSNLSDSLTNVYNRFSIINIIKNELSSSTHHSFGLYVLDVDYFKTYNDTYGHSIGDRLLFEVAKCMKELFTKGYIGRIGGDEFVIIDFEGDTKEKASSILTKLLKKINDIKLSDINLIDPISVTIGASFYPKNGSTYTELFNNADKALYIGKKLGRNKFQFID